MIELAVDKVEQHFVKLQESEHDLHEVINHAVISAHCRTFRSTSGSTVGVNWYGATQVMFCPITSAWSDTDGQLLRRL